MGLLDDEEFLRSQMRATPRNQLLGLLSDVIAKGYSPERTQQMQGLSKFLGAQEVSQTLDRLSYGEPLTTGAGGIGGTTRVRPEALDAAMAAMNLAPLVGPTARVAGKAAAAGAKALGPTAAAMGENYMGRMGMMPQLDVYHGTPHTLPPTPRNPLGEFDASKIGTGEGAQAYGQGIYTAEAKDVARTYSADRAYVGASMSGKPLPINYDDPAWIAQKTVDELGDPAKAKAHLEMVQRTAAKYQPPETKAAVQGAIDLISAGKVGTKGNLYKVDLPDEMIAKMLDYDKPLSKQDPAVRKMITESFPSGYINGVYIDPVKSQLTGKALLDQLSMISNKRNEPGFRSAETALRQAGIPGIKYLDATSRDAGKGTRNFVTFPGEEKKMTILERNGQGLTPALLPQQLALELAQQRAALPVSKGGLGLPADNTAQQRAAAMKFDKDAYHATDADILAFDNSKLGINTRYMTGGDLDAVKSAKRGHWFSDRDLTNIDPRGYMFGNVSYPVKLANPKKINDKEFGSQSYIVKNPDNIRSRFAAFDPFRRTAATAALMGVAAPDLLASEITDEEKKRQLAGLLYP